MKTPLLAASALVIGLGVSACHNNASDLPPGEYEKKTTSTDSRGTKTEREVNTNVTVDQYGNKRAVVETETTKDPRGLFNKETSTTREVIKERQNNLNYPRKAHAPAWAFFIFYDIYGEERLALMDLINQFSDENSTRFTCVNS